MKAVVCLLPVLVAFAFPVTAQDSSVRLGSPSEFRDAVALEVSLQDLTRAVDDMEQLQAMAERVLILEGIATSITVYSQDPQDFYVELELVGGTWEGVEQVEMHHAYVVFDDPEFAGRLAERAPRDTDASVIVRNDRVLIAGQLVSVAEIEDGEVVPVIQAYALRKIP